MAEVALVPAASSVLKVFKAVMGIRAAVAMDRRNQKDYCSIMMCVERVRNIMVYLQGVRELAMNPVMTVVLEDLARSLDEALELIQRCRGRKNKIHRLIKARETAKDLRRVEKDIDQKLQTGIFAGVMQMALTNTSISATYFVQERHQVSMIFIQFDFEYGKLYRNLVRAFFGFQDKNDLKFITFKQNGNNVFIEGEFDSEKLVCNIVSRARNVVKEIQILKKKEEQEEEKDEEEPNAVEDEESPVRSSQIEGTSMEGPWSLPALLGWIEVTHVAPNVWPSYPEGLTLLNSTTLSAAKLDVLRLRTNRTIALVDWPDDVNVYPIPCDEKYMTIGEASAPLYQQLDEGNENPAIASHPKRTKCPFGYKDVLILIQATVIIILMWYLM